MTERALDFLRRTVLAGLAAAFLVLPAAAQAPIEAQDGMVQLDFNDVEIAVVIDTIARLTKKNFIYDDRVRGRVTIVSPTLISIEQAYAVFESVLQVKGFTVVEGPGGALKVIPIREAKESNIETVRGETPESDRFITRLIPLRFIDAEAITNTLKPLVSKDASMVAYAPTNTVILTDAATNIRRILDILDSIDVETYKEELTVIKVHHADAGTLAAHLSEIFGADVADSAARAATRSRTTSRRAAAPVQTSAAETAHLGKVRIITDERTNSLILLASRGRLADIRKVVHKLDVPVTGGGRIHVYYLRHADAEELAGTLNSLVTGQPASAPISTARTGGQGATPQALRAAITELAEGVTVTADPPTNSLVIQASQEGYSTLETVIALLDVPRPQVLVEALIMEVDITNGESLGFSGLVRIFSGDDESYSIGSLTDSSLTTLLAGSSTVTDGDGDGDADGDGDGGGDGGVLPGDGDVNFSDVRSLLIPLLSAVNPSSFVATASVEAGSTLIQGIIRASANLSGANLISAPHILTSDNEEAEIKVGANIPIITSRVESGAGQELGLSSSVNVERQEIGITLRVTPQISEGDTLRLDIFQEITDINPALSLVTGNPSDVGVSLSSRKVENTVVVSDNETVVIGGLISEDYTDNVTKVPWLGDIPVLGWLFKTTSRDLQKVNLLVFLTPHIVRSVADLEEETIRKREEFWERSRESLELTDREKEEAEERRAAAEEAGLDFEESRGRNPVRGQLLEHSNRYPVERMREIERAEADAQHRLEEASAAALELPSYEVLAALYRDEAPAVKLLTDLVDAGWDGTLVSGEVAGAIVHEVRLGPFDELTAAEEAAEIVGESFGLSPSVVVLQPRTDEP
jgi:general secretion pathway protein D